MWTDFHCHCLPAIDDGSKDVGMSIEMIKQLREQQVDSIVATPHFYAWEETVESFLCRRNESDAALRSASDVKFLTGAEIALQAGLAETDISPLCIGQTDLLLLELPYMPYKPWMIREVENIAYTYRATPVFAHIDRYADWYTKKDLLEVLAFEDAVFQINVSAFDNGKSIKLVQELIERGLPVVLGSDAHNLTRRPPAFNIVNQMYQEKRKFQYIFNYILDCQNKVFL